MILLLTIPAAMPKKVTQDIREKTDILDELPKVGKKVLELNDETIREHSYRIIYEIKESDIFVLALLQKRRELQLEMIER